MANTLISGIFVTGIYGIRDIKTPPNGASILLYEPNKAWSITGRVTMCCSRWGVRDHSLSLQVGGLARFIINPKKNLWPPVIEMKKKTADSS